MEVVKLAYLLITAITALGLVSSLNTSWTTAAERTVQRVVDVLLAIHSNHE